MLKGVLRALDSDQMESLHCGALRVLEQTGLQIQGEFLLARLADAGCRVDFAARRAWFDPDLVERQVAAQRDRYKLVRSSLWYPFCRHLPQNDVAIPDEFIVDYGFTTPWFYDYPQRRYRQADHSRSSRHDRSGQRPAMCQGCQLADDLRRIRPADGVDRIRPPAAAQYP